MQSPIKTINYRSVIINTTLGAPKQVYKSDRDGDNRNEGKNDGNGAHDNEDNVYGNNGKYGKVPYNQVPLNLHPYKDLLHI